MNQRVVSLGCCLKVFKKLLSVADALENRFSLIPASGDMIKRTGKGNSQRPGHSPFPDHLKVAIDFELGEDGGFSHGTNATKPLACAIHIFAASIGGPRLALCRRLPGDAGALVL